MSNSMIWSGLLALAVCTSFAQAQRGIEAPASRDTIPTFKVDETQSFADLVRSTKASATGEALGQKS